jgi:hypothetical protein
VRLVLIADDHGILDADPPENLLQALGAQRTGVDANFGKHPAGEGMHLGGLEPRTEDLKAVARVMA